MLQTGQKQATNVVILLDALHSVAAGSERQIYQLIKGLVEQQVNVRLILLRHTQFSLSLKDFPCQISCLNITSLLSWHCLSSMFALRAELQRESCDCVHAWLPESCLLAPLFLKSSRRRIITSRRDMGLIYQGKPAWLYRLLRHRTDRVIGNSRAVMNYSASRESLAPDQQRVIHNGIDPLPTVQEKACSEMLFQLEHSLKLIMVANIKPIKRQLDAVDACLALNSEGTDCELALVGEAQDRAYHQQILHHLQSHPAGNRVHLTGSVQEPRHLLRQAQIGLLISESEGLSNTLMEYMSAGLAIIATNTGGNPELISHRQTGLLVPVDNQSALLQALHSYATHPELRQHTGLNARRNLEEKFSTKAMIAAHREEYFAHANREQIVTC